MKKASYPEGSVFLVPLRDSGFARGVVARSAPRNGCVLGYFFGPHLASQSASNLSGLEPQNAILKLWFGDLGLLKGLWPVIGRLPDWDPTDWPMPDFVRGDLLRIGQRVLVRYHDSDPSRVLSEEVLESDIDLAPDGLSGYGAVELKLSKILRENPSAKLQSSNLH
jgi:Immunity protein 26